jgi:branched-chain amino acid transport system permease protein
MLLTAELLYVFANADPTNPCLNSPGYVADEVQIGLSVGLVYAMMAAGLTLIYSVQRIISFAHGVFVMLGSVLAYVVLQSLPVNPLFIIPIIGIVGLVIGIIVAATLLRPVQTGRVERPDEYSLLMTFGLGIFLTYAIVANVSSTTGMRAPSYVGEHPLFGITAATFDVGAIRFQTDVLFAGLVGIIMFAGLIAFLYRTWVGRAFRAISMDRQAAAVAGINAGRMFVLAFGVGCMLATISGATLAPVFNLQIPDMAGQTAIRSFVIVVLGGLGSVPGSLVGGLIVGVTESMTAACYPDPNKGATYQIASGLIVFLAVLLLRPQGLFGRAEE